MLENILQQALDNLNDRGWEAFLIGQDDIEDSDTLMRKPVQELVEGEYLVFPTIRGSRTKKIINSMIDYVIQTYTLPIATIYNRCLELTSFSVTPDFVDLIKGERVSYDGFEILTRNVVPFTRKCDFEMFEPRVESYAVMPQMPAGREKQAIMLFVHNTYTIKKEYKPLCAYYLYKELSSVVSRLTIPFQNISNTSGLVRYKNDFFSVDINRMEELFGISILGEQDEARTRELFGLFYMTALNMADLGPTNLAQAVTMQDITRNIDVHFLNLNQYLAKMS